MPRVLILLRDKSGDAVEAAAPEGGALADVCDELMAPIPFSCRSANCGRSHRTWGGPPVAATFLSWLCAKNPRYWLSAETNLDFSRKFGFSSSDKRKKSVLVH